MKTEPMRVRENVLVNWTYGQILTRKRHGNLAQSQLEAWEQMFYDRRGRWPDESKDWTQTIRKRWTGCKR